MRIFKEEGDEYLLEFDKQPDAPQVKKPSGKPKKAEKVQKAVPDKPK